MAGEDDPSIVLLFLMTVFGAAISSDRLSIWYGETDQLQPVRPLPWAWEGGCGGAGWTLRSSLLLWPRYSQL